MHQTMNNRKKLTKNFLYLFVALGSTMITTSASANEALSLRENTQKVSTPVSNCIKNTREKNNQQKLTPLKAKLLASKPRRRYPGTSNLCRICVPKRGNKCGLSRYLYNCDTPRLCDC